MRSFLLGFLVAGCVTPTIADEVCTVAANKALEATVGATTTLATATKYMTGHDDWCDGNVQTLQEQDGQAVDHAWKLAIDAQSMCIADPGTQAQMAKLVATLHRRRLKISARLEALQYKCD